MSEVLVALRGSLYSIGATGQLQLTPHSAMDLPTTLPVTMGLSETYVFEHPTWPLSDAPAKRVCHDNHVPTALVAPPGRKAAEPCRHILLRGDPPCTACTARLARTANTHLSKVPSIDVGHAACRGGVQPAHLRRVSVADGAVRLAALADTTDLDGRRVAALGHITDADAFLQSFPNVLSEEAARALAACRVRADIPPAALAELRDLCAEPDCEFRVSHATLLVRTLDYNLQMAQPTCRGGTKYTVQSEEDLAQAIQLAARELSASCVYVHDRWRVDGTDVSMQLLTRAAAAGMHIHVVGRHRAAYAV